MASKGQITVNETLILEVNSDPSSDGITAPLSSIAVLDNNNEGKAWIKTGASSTEWSRIVDAETIKSLGFTQEVHVSLSGNDTGSTGKIGQPFLTLSAAISYVESTFTNGEPVVIYLHPGHYAGSFTITRPRTHLMGVQQTNAIITSIGSLTIAPTTVVGGVYNSSFSVEKVMISGTSGNSAAMTIGGTAECSIHLKNVYIYSSVADQKGLVVANSAANKSKLYFNDVLINNSTNNAIGAELSNSNSQIRNLTVYSGSSSCLKVTSSATVLAAFCLFESSGTLAINVESPSVTIGSSTITASGSNATGVTVAAGAVYTTVQNFYNVASGTGYAVGGSAGGVVTHAQNVFAYGTNNKNNSSLTMVAHSTSFVSS